VSDLGFSSSAGGNAPLRGCPAEGRVRRPARLLGLTARTACEATVLRLRGKLTGAAAIDFHVRTAERYAELLGHSKGVLMKAGQILSFTPIMVPPEWRSVYHGALARLRNDAPAMEPELARAVLERELGSLERAFAELDPEPLAAASIGQVHAARLHNGRRVAVKIQYPGASDAIVADLKNAELMATFVNLLWSGIPKKRATADIRGIVREVSLRVLEELDYRLEALTQAEFADLYRGHPFIHVPEVVEESCTARVLCQEFVEGLSWEEALAASQELRNRWAEAIFRFVYFSGECFSVFPADPHPGNFLFHENGSVSCLDFGCVKRFSREFLGLRASIGVPCANGDVLGTWQACVDVGLLRASDPVTPEETYAWWREYLEFYWAEPAPVLTPELIAEWLGRCYSPRGPSANYLRHITVPSAFTLLNRIELGTTSLIGELRASIQWGSISAEYTRQAPPSTEMGKLHHAFMSRRERDGS
jgi:predicted unusual protein kinase regulating ubiquinone biosynthesis (AarF/ABC1/UbiB family)